MLSTLSLLASVMNNNFPGEAQNDQRVADFWTTYLVRIATLVVAVV